MTAPACDTYRDLIALAVAEDRGGGDVTSELLFPEPNAAEARLVAREAMVVCGMDVVREVLSQYDADLDLTAHAQDGAAVEPGDALGRISGPLVSLLAAERVVLNFLQRLCGVATLTRAYVRQVAGTRARIYDTRKTTPGWRVLEKYAVRCGGGHNHRMGLYDGVLIKDNHLAEFGDALQPKLTALVTRARTLEGVAFIEVEVDSLEQFRQVLAVPGIDIVLLDNMGTHRMREAVTLRDRLCGTGGPRLEASGGVTLASVAAVARCGVERIAIGALTHSARAMDIGLDR